jgi:hypothetical protein
MNTAKPKAWSIPFYQMISKREKKCNAFRFYETALRLIINTDSRHKDSSTAEDNKKGLPPQNRFYFILFLSKHDIRRHCAPGLPTGASADANARYPASNEQRGVALDNAEGRRVKHPNHSTVTRLQPRHCYATERTPER